MVSQSKTSRSSRAFLIGVGSYKYCSIYSSNSASNLVWIGSIWYYYFDCIPNKRNRNDGLGNIWSTKIRSTNYCQVVASVPNIVTHMENTWKIDTGSR